MNTLFTSDKKLFFIELALFFLALGIMTSSSIVSGYEVLIVIPALFVHAKREYNYKLSKSSICLIALVIWGLISITANWQNIPNKLDALSDLKFYFLGVFLIAPINYFFQKASVKQKRFLFNVFLFTIIVAFFVGIAKSLFGIDVVKMEITEPSVRSGGFNHIMRYGYSNGMIFILLLSMFFNRQRIQDYITPKLFYPALILSFLAVFTSATRGVLLGILVALPFVIYRYYPKLVKYLLITSGSIFMAFALATVFIGDKANNRYLNFNDINAQVRFIQYHAGLIALQENPITGLGPKQFSLNSIDIKVRHNLGAQDFVGHTHNTFIEHAANLGSVGLVLFVLFMLFWFLEMISLKSAFGWAVAGYIITYSVSGQFEHLFNSANSHLNFFLYSWSMTMLTLFKNKKQVY